MKYLSIFVLIVFARPAHSAPSHAQVNRYSTDIRIENGTSIYKRSVSIQINDPKGSEYTTIKIPYSKGNRVKNLKGEITDINGITIRSLKKSEITDKSGISNISLYDDGLVKQFTLNHNQYPFVIKFSYTIEYDQFISLAKWSSYYYNLPTYKSQLTLTVPESYPIKYYERDIQPATISTDEKGNTTYQWKNESIPAVKIEKKGPSFNQLSPLVFVIPERFKYGVEGNSTSWKGYGNWLCHLSQGHNDFTDEDKEQVRSIVKGETDTLEIIKRLYTHIQDDMRYIYVGIDIGGMKTYPASYVAQNKYGDCKALSYYMKSCLDLFDIESFPVEVYYDKDHVVIEDMPSHQANHIFLAVPLEEDTVWLENTTGIGPFNYIDYEKQGNKALWVHYDSSQLITLPKMKYEDVKNHYTFQYRLSEEELKGHLSSKLKGELFERLNYVYSKYNATDRKSYLNRRFLSSNTELHAFDIIKKDRNDRHIFLELDITTNGLVKSFGNNRVITIPSLALPEFESPSKRTQPVLYHAPEYRVDDIYLEYDSELYENVILKEPEKVNSKYGSYSVSFTRTEDNRVHCHRELQIVANRYSLDEYDEFYQFIQSIKKLDSSKNIILKP